MSNTKPLKKHKSISEQVALLESRGLLIESRDEAEDFLEHVNYYRFTGYLHEFKQKGSDTYVSGLSFRQISEIYKFDTKQTRILMYVLEDIEETLKTRFSYTLSKAFPDDPQVYLKQSVYKSVTELKTFKRLFKNAKENNKELPFIKHYISNVRR